MLARKPILPHFKRWNDQWGAPFGRPSKLVAAFGRVMPRSLRTRLSGPFHMQANNTTRTFEYPWAYYSSSPERGQKVLEIGGGLSGFQFVLSRVGCAVVNVDPGLEARGIGWRCTSEDIAALNRAFGTNVELRNTVLHEANLTAESFDIAYSISVVEHLEAGELDATIALVSELLKPGGRFILTVDLFLDLAPFTSRMTNTYGRNVDVRRLIDASRLEVEIGNREELYGFDEFDPDAIQRNLQRYVIGKYPTLVQCLVLQKADAPRAGEVLRRE